MYDPIASGVSGEEEPKHDRTSATGFGAAGVHAGHGRCCRRCIEIGHGRTQPAGGEPGVQAAAGCCDNAKLCAEVRRACCHDIGKIGVPDSVCSKNPGLECQHEGKIHCTGNNTVGLDNHPGTFHSRGTRKHHSPGTRDEPGHDDTANRFSHRFRCVREITEDRRHVLDSIVSTSVPQGSHRRRRPAAELRRLPARQFDPDCLNRVLHETAPDRNETSDGFCNRSWDRVCRFRTDALEESATNRTTRSAMSDSARAGRTLNQLASNWARSRVKLSDAIVIAERNRKRRAELQSAEEFQWVELTPRQDGKR